MAISLYYIGGYRQGEIADWLGISVTAVKQRLFSARRRLRKDALAMLREPHEDRPSRNEEFVDRVHARLRPFMASDYALLPRMVEAVDPGNEDNATWLRNRETFDRAGLIPRAYIAEAAGTGETLGYGCIEQVNVPSAGDYPPTGRPGVDTFRLHLLLSTDGNVAEVGRALFEKLEADAKALGASGMWVREFVHHGELLELLHDRGFWETSRVQEWHLGTENWVQPLVSNPHLEITTLTEERASDRSYVNELKSFWDAQGSEATQVSESYSEAEIESRLSRPHVEPDSYFIARLAGRIVGVLSVRRPPSATPYRPDVTFRVIAEAAAGDVEDQLLAAAVQFARRTGYPFFTTHVFPVPSTTALLQRLGFRRYVEMALLTKQPTGPMTQA